MAAGSTDGAVLERESKISYSLHQSTSLGNLGLRSVCESLWGYLLAPGAVLHVLVQCLGLDPRCLDGGQCPAVMAFCVTLCVWNTSETASPKNAFGRMGDPEVWLIHTVKEVLGSSGGFSSAPAWQDRAGLVSERC